jgi:hypothetical protein
MRWSTCATFSSGDEVEANGIESHILHSQQKVNKDRGQNRDQDLDSGTGDG